MSCFVNSSADFLSSALGVTPAGTTSRSTGTAFAHEMAGTAGRSANPAMGFPSKAGSTGSPSIRHNVGVMSKTLARPRTPECATAGPAAARLPGWSCPKNAGSKWSTAEEAALLVPQERGGELDAGRVGRAPCAMPEAVVRGEDQRRSVPGGAPRQLTEYPVGLDVQRRDTALVPAEILLGDRRHLRRLEAPQDVPDLVGALEIDHQELGGSAVVKVERDLRVHTRDAEDLPVTGDRIRKVLLLRDGRVELGARNVQRLRHVLEGRAPLAPPDEAHAVREALGPREGGRLRKHLGVEQDGRRPVGDEEALHLLGGPRGPPSHDAHREALHRSKIPDRGHLPRAARDRQPRARLRVQLLEVRHAVIQRRAARGDRRPDERRGHRLVRVEVPRPPVRDERREIREAPLLEKPVEELPVGSVPADEDHARPGRRQLPRAPPGCGQRRREKRRSGKKGERPRLKKRMNHRTGFYWPEDRGPFQIVRSPRVCEEVGHLAQHREVERVLLQDPDAVPPSRLELEAKLPERQLLREAVGAVVPDLARTLLLPGTQPEGIRLNTNGARKSGRLQGSLPHEYQGRKRLEAGLERHTNRAPGASGYHLAIVDVVRAGCRGSANRPVRPLVPRLDAGLTVERAARVGDERTVRVEALVNAGGHLPVQEVEDVELGSDRHRADLELVSKREVRLVVGREASLRAALREIKEVRVVRVEEAELVGGLAAPGIGLKSDSDPERRLIDRIEANLVRPVELELAVRILIELVVVIVRVDAGVRLAGSDADGAGVGAAELRVEIGSLQEERVRDLLLGDEFDAHEVALRRGHGLTRQAALSIGGIGWVRRPVAGRDLTTGDRSGPARVGDGTGRQEGVAGRIEVAAILDDARAELAVGELEAERERGVERLLEAERELFLVRALQARLDRLAIERGALEEGISRHAVGRHGRRASCTELLDQRGWAVVVIGLLRVRREDADVQVGRRRPVELAV